MAGIGTVLKDDPMLNTRIEGKKSPIRIICDSRLQIPLESKICQSAKEYPTIIACADAEQEKSRFGNAWSTGAGSFKRRKSRFEKINRDTGRTKD